MSTQMLQTEYEFTLPRGYVDEQGNVCRHGSMRLATAKDELKPLDDPRVQRSPAYLVVILLARVVALEDVTVTPQVIENLFASDLTYLQNLYNELNGDGTAMVGAICPQCNHSFDVEVERSGES